MSTDEMDKFIVEMIVRLITAIERAATAYEKQVAMQCETMNKSIQALETLKNG